MMGKVIKQPLEALEEYFGFNQFLDGQDDVVQKILDGSDGLVVMPTGGGKSLCYQLPMNRGIVLRGCEEEIIS